MAFEFKAGNKKYVVVFEHVYRDTRPISTRCSVSQKVGRGVVTCSVAYSKTAHGDNFDRTKGRRIALQKALNIVWPETTVKYDSKNGRHLSLSGPQPDWTGKKKVVTNRVIRAAAWKEYFQQVEKPRLAEKSKK